jgi:hypothetical protein
MFNNQFFTDPTALNKAIDDLLEKINDDPDTEEQTKMVELLTKLYKLKEIDVKLTLQDAELKHKEKMAHAEQLLKEEELRMKKQAQLIDSESKSLDIETKKREMKIPFGIKPETVVTVAANLIGIALVLNHEKLNVVTSKAFGFVTKLKN